MQILLKANVLAPLEDTRLDLCRRRFFEAPGELFDALLAHYRATGEVISFLRDMRWTVQEMAQADAFLIARAQSLAQSAKLRVRQQAELQRTPTTSKWGSIVTYGSVQLDRWPPPSSFCTLDQWTNELLAAPDLDKAPLQGAHLHQVRNAFHVKVQHILGPVAWDEALWETWDDGPAAPSTPRHRGTLTFPSQSLGGDWDLARTAEPFGCNGTGLLVVSRRFYDWYCDSGWKGLHFWPVWCNNTPTAQAHRVLWQTLLAQLQTCPKAQLRC